MTVLVFLLSLAVPCVFSVWALRNSRKISTPYKSRNVAKSHIKRAPSFVAIDFETANSKYYSACSLGIVVFAGGVPKYRNLYMINPCCNFAPENTAIHGITAEQVVNAPRFDTIWPQLVPFFKEFDIVAYSEFDAKVLRSLIHRYGLGDDKRITINYFDVCQYARANILGLANYKLPTVAEFLHINGLKHHDAVSDAETCGKIYVRLCAERGRKIIASASVPATYAQQDYIRNLGGHVPPTLSKSDASILINELIIKNRREMEEAAVNRRREKEDKELHYIAAAMREPGYKPSKRGAKRTQDLRELQHLISRVIADDVIDPREMLEIQAWLEAHKVLPEDFASALSLISQLRESGKYGQSDDMKSLYDCLLDCLNELRKRPSA